MNRFKEATSATPVAPFARRPMLFSILALAASVSLSFALSAQVSGKSDDPQITAAKAKYQFDTWNTGALLPGFDLTALELPGYEGGETDLTPSSMVLRRFAGSDGRSPVVVELRVSVSIDKAHDLLAGAIAFVSSTKTLPTTRASDIAAGDHGYVGYSGAAAGRISWIAFVQGNVSVRLCCLDPRRTPHPDMGLLAEHVSREIGRTAPLARGATVPRPTIQGFTADSDISVAGQDVGLDVEWTDPNGKPPQMFWSVGGTAQGYVEVDDEGSPRLFTTRGGTLKLKLTLLGSNGTTASREIEIKVQPD